MKDTLDYVFKNWINFVLTISTASIAWVVFIGGIRVILETSIPLMFQKCAERYFITKHTVNKATKAMENE